MSTIPQSAALRVPHLHRGGYAIVLGKHNTSIGTTGGAFPIIIPFSLPLLLYASLSKWILDEWRQSLHDLRKSRSAHWWARRVIDNDNKYRHLFLHTPSNIKYNSRQQHFSAESGSQVCSERFKRLVLPLWRRGNLYILRPLGSTRSVDCLV